MNSEKDSSAKAPFLMLLKSILGLHIVRFGLVSAVATVVDYAVLIMLVHLQPDNKAFMGFAIAAGYILGTLVHFVLTRKLLIFKPTEHHVSVEFIMVAVVAGIGLALTEVIIFYSRPELVQLGLRAPYDIGTAKTIALVIVFFWNYLGRKYFIYHEKNVAE